MIWAFFSRRIRMWLLLAVGAPILGRVLGFVGDRLAARHGGPTTLSRALCAGRDWLARRSSGPLAGRPTATAPVPQRRTSTVAEER